MGCVEDAQTADGLFLGGKRRSVEGISRIVGINIGGESSRG